MSNAATKACPGRTSTGAPCNNRTRRGGWCGRCANPGGFYDPNRRSEHTRFLRQQVTEGDDRAVWELAGVHPDDIDWVQGHGLRPPQIEDWLARCGADYDPQAWVRWHRSGVQGSQNPRYGVLAYRLRGFTDPETIAVLAEQHVPASIAGSYRLRGLTDPTTIALYMHNAVPPWDAAWYTKAGFGPYDGLDLFDAGVSGFVALTATKLGYRNVDAVIGFTQDRVRNRAA